MLPTASSDAVINGVATNVTITIGASVTVQSLQCSASLNVSGGNLTLTKGSSQVAGNFTMASGHTLTVSGLGSAFSAAGTATIDNASLRANSGASILVPGLRSYTQGSTYPNWQANGAGSMLALPALTNLTASNYGFDVQALAGGQVLLTNVLTLAGSGLQVRVDGSNSVVDLSRLTGVTDTNGVPSFTASNGGVILIPLVTELDGVSLTLGANAGMDLTGLASLRGGRLSLSSGNMLELPSLANLDTSSLYVSDGSVLSLPGLRSCRKAGDVWYVKWEVSGAGSVLLLPALTNLVSVWWYDLTRLRLRPTRHGALGA